MVPRQRPPYGHKIGARCRFIKPDGVQCLAPRMRGYQPPRCFWHQTAHGFAERRHVGALKGGMARLAQAQQQGWRKRAAEKLLAEVGDDLFDEDVQCPTCQGQGVIRKSVAVSLPAGPEPPLS